MRQQRSVTLLLMLMMLVATLAGGSAPGPVAAAAPPTGATAAAEPAACTINFSDVPAGSWFHDYVQYLFCSGAVSGYGSEFRPFAQTTRAQLTKMISLTLGWAPTAGGAAHFADVPATFPLYGFVETAFAHNIIAGYACGGPGEACDSQNRPYFRPYADVTRAQLAKMIVLAQGWAPLTPAQPTFGDVPSGAWYFGFVEAVNAQGVTSGYADNTFRPFASATRAQLAKMLYTGVTPPSFDQADNESELQAQDAQTEEVPADLDPGVDGGPGPAQPQGIGTSKLAPATATISGTVTSTDTSGPLAGATVLVRPVGGGTVVTATTDVNGQYSLAVAAGSYNVSAADRPALYPVTESAANPITVPDGGGTTVNFALTEGGVIAGTISDADGNPVADAHEWALPIAPPPPEAFGGSASDSQGHYRIVVPAGHLAAWAEKASATFPRTPPAAGNPLTVTVGMTTTADFTLRPGGVIAGHITDAATQAPLPGSTVWARHEPLAIPFGAASDAQGAYRIVVPGGTTYNVHALNVPGMYPRGDYPGNPVTVTTGVTVTADLALTQGGEITGVIRGEDTGQPLAGARAIAHHPETQRYWSNWTDPNGLYRVIVPAGAWNLYGRSDWQGYVRTPAPSNPISVTAGSAVTVDLSLHRGAIVTGRVTDAASHDPIPYAHVWANPPGPGGPNFGFPASGWDGRYVLAVPAGTWGLYAREDRAGYPRQGYPGNYVTLVAGQTYTADFALTRGAIIHGRLTDATTGQPLAEASVWARAPQGGLGYGWPETEEDGHYVLAVPAGRWLLFARDLPGLYPRTAYPGDPITVAAGDTVVADWALTRGGLITGQITDAHTGQPLPAAFVWAREVGGSVRDADFHLTGDGTYALVVPAGDYRLRAADLPGGYPALAYPGNPVHVTAGATTTASWGLVRW